MRVVHEKLNFTFCFKVNVSTISHMKMAGEYQCEYQCIDKISVDIVKECAEKKHHSL